jgi:hypothetical protein
MLKATSCRFPAFVSGRGMKIRVFPDSSRSIEHDIPPASSTGRK